MKTKKSTILFLFVIVAVACSDFAEETTVVVTDDDIAETRAVDSNEKDYYWYQGEKIYLTRNEKYVNIVAENGELVKSSKSEATAQARTRSGDTRYKLLPFFERGEGAEPIGTSEIFYLKLKKAEDIALLQKLADKLGVQVIEDIPHTPCWYTLSILGSEFGSSIEASNFFYETGQFEDIDPAFMFDFKAHATPNDPEFGRLWGMKNTSYPGYDINVVDAWDITRGTGITIAVLDEGIDFGHDDLSANLLPLSFSTQTGQSPSVLGGSHGTHVAGIIAATGNNNLYVTGVAYESKLMDISHSLANTSTASAEFASGINWAWQNGADIINNSWGTAPSGFFYSNLHSSVLESAIVDAMTKGRKKNPYDPIGMGCVVVFSSGNDGNIFPGEIGYPGNFHSDIITVGAIDPNGGRRQSSSYGAELDVVAPGTNILSTIPFLGTNIKSGTSMAAPHVSGIAALILSVNPDLTQRQVADIIEQTAQKVNSNTPYVYATTSGRPNGGWNQEMGYGLVDAYAAVMASTPVTPAILSGWANPVEENTNISFSVSNPQSGVTYEWESNGTIVQGATGSSVSVPTPAVPTASPSTTLTVRCRARFGSNVSGWSNTVSHTVVRRTGIDFTISNYSSYDIDNLYVGLTGKIGNNTYSTTLINQDPGLLPSGSSAGLPNYKGRDILAIPGTQISNLTLNLWASSLSTQVSVVAYLTGYSPHSFYTDFDGDVYASLPNITVPSAGQRRMLNIILEDGPWNYSAAPDETIAADSLTNVDESSRILVR